MNDGPDFEPKRRINIFPLILSLLIIGLIITLLVRTFTNTAQEIAYSNLDEYFKTTEPAQKPAYIFNWTAKSNYQATQISGEYVYKPESSESYSRKKFVVYVPNENFTNSFKVTFVNKNVAGDPGAANLIASLDASIYKTPGPIDGGKYVEANHISYQDFFELKTNITKLAFVEGSDYYNPILVGGFEAKKGEIGYVIGDAFVVSFWEKYGFYIIFAVFEILILILLLRRLSASMRGSGGQIGGDNIFSFNKSRAKRQENSKIKFDDVAGCDEEKAELVEMVEYLKEPLKFSKFGAKLPKGVLLVGPPGTGKTLLAKSVAGEAGVPFFSISGSDFVEMFVGVGAGRVRDLFNKAKQSAPCVVFIDEIDAVGRQRGAGLGGGNDEREQTLNQLLVEMDGFTDNQGIIVMAATNRDDVLDPALLRAGRFDRQIIVNLPDKKGREEIFKVHARNKIIDPSVSWEQLAKRTVGFSGADIENVLNEAAILAVRRKHQMILLEDVDEAIDRRIGGPAKKNKNMTPYERKSIAYHEAGHAIIGLTLPESDKVQKITIVPRGNTGGHVLMTPENDRFLLTKNELIAKITGYLGGRTSEEIFFNDISTGASNDIEVATRIARLMVTEYGMSSLGPIQYEKDTGSVFLGRDYTNSQKNFSNEIAVEIDKEIRKIIDDCHKQATDIIKKRKNDVILIAETLLEHETITAEEIGDLLKNRKLNGSSTEEAKSVETENKTEKEPKDKKSKKK